MQTIDITPDWAGMRRWVLHVARTDLETALTINTAMGSEGVESLRLMAAERESLREELSK